MSEKDYEKMEEFTKPWEKDKGKFKVYNMRIRTTPTHMEALKYIAMLATPNPILTRELYGEEKEKFLKEIREITEGWKIITESEKGEQQ